MTLVTTMRDETRNLLAERPRTLTLEQIAKDTGLSERWLRLFSRSGSEHPSVVFVETLHTYLVNRTK